MYVYQFVELGFGGFGYGGMYVNVGVVDEVIEVFGFLLCQYVVYGFGKGRECGDFVCVEL